MTRALSVAEGKGAVNSLASQPISCEGSVSRGYCAARWSGPEKSRHTRQQVFDVPAEATGCAEPLKRGFVAWILERSGRDECGIGGGVPFGAVLSAGVLLGLPGTGGALFKPPKPVWRILFRSCADGVGGSLRTGRLGLGSSA